MKWNEFINQYITEIDRNVYQLNYTSDAKYQIRKEIIRRKQEATVTLNDLYLVRMTDAEFYPKNMIYYPLDKKNSYQYIDNPFSYILKRRNSYNRKVIFSETESKEYQLVCPNSKRTKHFSINGLARNIYKPYDSKNEFKNGIFIVIEPLIEKIEDKRLVFLDYANTFFDLYESKMNISESAALLIEKRAYMGLEEQQKVKFENRKIFIFEGNPVIATEIALIYLEALPQRFESENILREEYLKVSNTPMDDEKYLLNFVRTIAQLNLQYATPNIINPFNVYSLKHSKEECLEIESTLAGNKYEELDQKENMKSIIQIYEEYIKLIVSETTMEQQIGELIYSTIKQDVLKMECQTLGQDFYRTYRFYYNELEKIIEELGINKFQNITENYNKKKILQVDKNRLG